MVILFSSFLFQILQGTGEDIAVLLSVSNSRKYNYKLHSSPFKEKEKYTEGKFHEQNMDTERGVRIQTLDILT